MRRTSRILLRRQRLWCSTIEGKNKELGGVLGTWLRNCVKQCLFIVISSSPDQRYGLIEKQMNQFAHLHEINTFDGKCKWTKNVILLYESSIVCHCTNNET